MVSNDNQPNGVLNGNGIKHSTHPLDPLTADEISIVVDIVRAKRSDTFFNSVSLKEPKKSFLQKWLVASASGSAMPLHRIADVIATTKDNKVHDILVDISDKQIVQWSEASGLYPSITMEDLQKVEQIAREDPKVIEQCEILGISKEEMEKIYCDPWTIGYDERFDDGRRLQQAFMYYRPHVDDW